MGIPDTLGLRFALQNHLIDWHLYYSSGLNDLAFLDFLMLTFFSDCLHTLSLKVGQL